MSVSVAAPYGSSVGQHAPAGAAQRTDGVRRKLVSGSSPALTRSEKPPSPNDEMLCDVSGSVLGALGDVGEFSAFAKNTSSSLRGVALTPRSETLSKSESNKKERVVEGKVFQW